MSTKVLHILALILSALTIAGGLDLTGILKILPEGWAAVLATVPPLLMALAHFILALGDQLDDGQKNDSFPGSLKMHPVTFLMALALGLLAGSMTSCENLTLTASTPWGDVSSLDGMTTVAVKPIRIVRDK